MYMHEGRPGKPCDQVSDAVLDARLIKEPKSKGDVVMVAGT